MNYKPLGFNAKDIDGLILGHGHLDHCGRIPLLVTQGFRRHIYSTPHQRHSQTDLDGFGIRA
ncbi:MAG: MBL fold metallo-hydrolase [Dissulfurimicrobium sp.]|uniref:MBL fold metallo-hydrolase n=1 Tax=Dissulfurimicrobium sp. TaxID=2022436 RepID=UPI004049A363